MNENSFFNDKTNTWCVILLMHTNVNKHEKNINHTQLQSILTVLVCVRVAKRFLAVRVASVMVVDLAGI